MTVKPAPANVARFQEAYAAPSRVVVLQALLKESLTYPELFKLIPEEVMSRSALHVALKELTRFGYIADDAPEGVARKPKRTRVRAHRELVAEDLAATLVWLLG